MKKNDGFTLLELLVALIIVAILAAIAAPKYSNSRIQVARLAAQAEMLNVARELSDYKSLNKTYDGVSLNGFNGNTKMIPENASVPSHEIIVKIASDGKSYEITAVPNVNSIQKWDGWICLNSLGQRYWAKGFTSCTTLSKKSKWYKDL